MAETPILHFSSFRLDLENRQLWHADEAVPLRPKTFAVLRHLVERAGRLVTRDELVASVWEGASGAETAPKYCIRELRVALGDRVEAPRIIEAVGRIGYRFVAPVTGEAVPSGPTVGAANGHAPPPAMLFGREAELGELDAALRMALGGERQVVLVSGEPGIGKTSVVEAFLRSAPGLCIGRGHCIPQFGEGEPYLPALQALGRLTGGPEPRGLGELLARLAPSWLAQMPALQDELPDARRSRAQGASQRRMLREVADALEALSRQVPLALLLEDVHWADYSSLDFVAAIAHDPRPARLLLIVTYRSTELAEDHPLRALARELVGRGKARPVALTGISAAAVHEYVEARFAQHAFSAVLAPLLFRWTAGQPLFLVDLVEHLVDQGIVQDAEGTWRLQVPAERIAGQVPRNSRLLIEKQMAGLRRERQALLEAAGLVGLEFCAEAIAPALGMTAEHVEEHLDALAGSGVFVDRRGVEAWPDGTRSARYRFRHPLYRQLWAERTAPQRRQRLHLRIGERLERAHAAHAEEVAAELALHFSEGGDMARAVGYRLAAAHNAIRRSAHREAVDHLTSALGRLAELPSGSERDYQELGLRIVLGMALTAISGYTAAEVEENYRRSLDLSDRLGDAWQIVQALLGLCPFYLLRGELAVAQRLAERCARELEPASDLEVAVCNALGATALWRGEFTASRGHLERSAALHDPGLHASSVLYDATNPGVACLAHLAWVLWALGFPDRALERSREAIALARQLEHAYSLSYALTFGATFHVFRREPGIALEHVDEALGLAGEHDFPFWQAMGSILRGWAVAVTGGGNGDGLSLMRQGLSAFDLLGVNAGRTALLALLAEACDACGEPAEGLRVLHDAEAMADRSGERFYAAEILRVRGELLLRQDCGRTTDCEHLFRQAMKVARRQEARSWELRAALSLARLQRRERGRRAGERLAPVYAWFREGFGTRDLIEAKALLEEPGPSSVQPGE